MKRMNNPSRRTMSLWGAGSLGLLVALAGTFLLSPLQPVSAATNNVGLLRRDLAGPSYMPMSGMDGSPSGRRPNPVQVSGSTRNKILQAAQSQLGIHEWGNSCNPYGPCEAWCALFASWTWRQSGINFSTALSGSFYYYGRDHGTLHSRLSHPQSGDAIVFGYGAHNPRTSGHVGIIEQVLSNGQVISIEGNYDNQVKRVGPYSPSRRGAYAIVSPS